MQAQLERIPPEYFDTTKGHILRKNAQRSRKKKHLKRRKTKKVTSREERRESCKLTLIVVLNVLLCMCLAAYILWRLSIKVDVVVCPPGYFGEKCERNDFVDSTPWESVEVFKAANREVHKRLLFPDVGAGRPDRQSVGAQDGNGGVAALLDGVLAAVFVSALASRITATGSFPCAM